MGKEPKDKKKKSPDPEPEERPTIVPDFDPAELARETASSSKGPSTPARGAVVGVADVPRDAHNERTLMRKVTLGPDSASPETTQMPDSMRSSLLSMADSRVPSVKPAPQRIPSVSGLPVSELDRGWEDLGLGDPISDQPNTKPSPSDGPSRRETSRLRAPSGSRTAADDESEQPTKEHAVIGGGGPATSLRGVPRDEPGAETRHETPENTVFAPARAAAALTAPSNRPRALSEHPPAVAVADAAPAPMSAADTVREMRDRFSLGDYTGALVLADGLLDDDPNNPEVKECAENCRQVLRQMYTARIGPLDRVPVVTVARDQLRWLSIDHRAGFVLSHIDGVSTLELILDVSGMPLLDALRILCELAQQRIISFR